MPMMPPIRVPSGFEAPTSFIMCIPMSPMLRIGRGSMSAMAATIPARGASVPRA